jgi:hypothetical protein
MLGIVMAFIQHTFVFDSQDQPYEFQLLDGIMACTAGSFLNINCHLSGYVRIVADEMVLSQCFHNMSFSIFCRTYL